MKNLFLIATLVLPHNLCIVSYIYLKTNKTQLPKELFFDLTFFAFAHGLEAVAGCIYNFINHGNSLNII